MLKNFRLSPTYAFGRMMLLIAFIGISIVPTSFAMAQSTGTSGALVSENWAGYTSDMQGSIYSGVGASWVMPNAATPVSSGEASWVGIGGFQDQDLIQVGTLTLINDQGMPQYYAWYEMLPADPVAISLAVHPGDSMTASIVPLSGTDQWLIYIRNNTTGQSFNTTVTYHTPGTSAEWIEEVPTQSSSGQYLALSQFGTVNFTDAWTIQDGARKTISQAFGNQMYLLDFNSNAAEAVPSNLGADGASFNVTRTGAVQERTRPTSQIGRWYRITIEFRSRNGMMR